MNRWSDIDPMDLDPETGRPYSNYSSPSLDTSFHDGEMDVGDEPAGPLVTIAGHRYLLTALHEGWVAKLSGQGVEDCPYRGGIVEASWLKGHKGEGER